MKEKEQIYRYINIELDKIRQASEYRSRRFEKRLDNIQIFAESSSEKINQVIKEFKQELSEKVTEEVSNAFASESIKFAVEKKMFEIVASQMKAEIRDSNFHTIIRETLSDKFEYIMKPIADDIVQKILEELIKKYRQEAETVKSLVYSIDSTVKHHFMTTGYSEEMESKVIKKLSEAINTNKEQIKIEMKK